MMIRYLMGLGLVLALIGIGEASPYLVSNAYPTTQTQIDHCHATEGATIYVSPAVANPDGSVYCRIDLATVPDGNHAVQVVATLTGHDPSSPTPFSFGKWCNQFNCVSASCFITVSHGWETLGWLSRPIRSPYKWCTTRTCITAPCPLVITTR